MTSVFQKFGGIRPMAAKLPGVPPSTVKSWHSKGAIPGWRHDSILSAAEAHGIELRRDELEHVQPDKADTSNEAA